MGDRRLRELERSCAETRSLADETRLLRARLQAGEASQVRVWLAAHLEHPASRAALQGQPPPVEAEVSSLQEVLELFDPRVQVCAGLAVLSLGLAEWEREVRWVGPCEVAEHATRWLEGGHQEARSEELRRLESSLFFYLFGASLHRWVAETALWVSETITGSAHGTGCLSLPEPSEEAYAAMRHVLLPWCLQGRCD